MLNFPKEEYNLSDIKASASTLMTLLPLSGLRHVMLRVNVLLPTDLVLARIDGECCRFAYVFASVMPIRWLLYRPLCNVHKAPAKHQH